MNAFEITIIVYLILGYILGRKLPLNVMTFQKLVYGIRGIPYWYVNIISGGKVEETKIVKKSKEFFSYDGGKYYMYANDNDIKYTPYLIIWGQEHVFFNKNNLNPLNVKERDIEPEYNNPSIFASMINNREIQNSISDSSLLINELKRYILISMIVVSAIMTGIVYLLLNYSPGG